MSFVWRFHCQFQFLSASHLDATLATVDPDNFQCEEDSPIQAPDWSNTQPSVALTHNFCGQINSKGEAEGFHSRPDGEDPPSASAIGYPTPIGSLQCFPGEEVLGVARTPPSGKFKMFCFFPEEWSIPDTVNVLLNEYKRCPHNSDKICVRNYPGKKPFDIIIFLGKDENGATGIVSAFATPANTVSCSGTENCKK